MMFLDLLYFFFNIELLVYDEIMPKLYENEENSKSIFQPFPDVSTRISKLASAT